MERSRFLGLLTSVALILPLIAACSSPAPQAAAPQPAGQQQARSFDWKRFQGKDLRVWIYKSAFSDYIEKQIPDFEQLTGIKVSFESMSDLQYRPKLAVDLTAGSTAFDVYSSMTIQEGEKFGRSGWYEPLDKYLSDPTMTSPDFDVEDFTAAAKESARVRGKTVVLPFEAQTMVLYYRKDLFQQAGLKPPTTFDEMEAAAKALNTPPETYGIVLRGAGGQISSQFSGWLYSFGGTWLDDKGNPALDSEAALKAFDTYGRLARQYGPPGGVNMNWIQVGEYFAQGKAAQLLDINIQYPRVNDPGSPAHGKVGVAAMPQGPAGSKPFVAGWGLALNPKGKNKDAGWYFIQWALNKQNLLNVQLAGNPTPRVSAWSDPKFKAQDPSPELTAASLAGYAAGHPYMNPPIVAAPEARDIVGVVGTAAMQGGDVAAEAKKANQQLKDLISKTK